MPYDAHIHLDLYEREALDAMLESAFGSGGIDGVVAVSMGMESCVANRELARRYPGRIMPAYGHHPEQPPLSEKELEALCDWIRERKDEPFAIGEVGLPYYTRKEAEERGEPFDDGPYLRQLERFVALAAELNRPIALHSVYEDADATMELLERYRVRRAHFHWFKGSPQSVARMVDNGYFISVTPDVEYENEIRELAAVYPLNQLMVETDGPWPFEGSFAGKDTEPGMIRAVIREIAALRGLREDEVDTVVRRNTELFYRWNMPQP